MGPDLKHWVETVVTSALCLIAVLLAWYLQVNTRARDRHRW